jgi:hypothetical protein
VLVYEALRYLFIAGNLNQVQAATLLHNEEQDVQASVATKFNSSNAAGFIKIILAKKEANKLSSFKNNFLEFE